MGTFVINSDAIIITGTAFNIMDRFPAWASHPSACGDNITFNTYYHNGSGAGPIIGDFVYTDAAMTNPFPGFSNTSAQQHWKTDQSTTISIKDTGEVNSLQSC